jgi:hypothetical protein
VAIRLAMIRVLHAAALHLTTEECDRLQAAYAAIKAGLADYSRTSIDIRFAGGCDAGLPAVDITMQAHELQKSTPWWPHKMDAVDIGMPAQELQIHKKHCELATLLISVAQANPFLNPAVGRVIDEGGILDRLQAKIWQAYKAGQGDAPRQAGEAPPSPPAELQQVEDESSANVTNGTEGLIERDGDHWRFTFAGKKTPALDHTLGMELIVWLLTHPGENVAAADLYKAVKTTPKGVAKSINGLVESKQTTDGGSGPLREIQSESDVGRVYDRGGIDVIQEARRQLEVELETAEDPAMKAETQEKVEAIDKWCAANTDKFGRSRKLADPAEKARKRVSKAIDTALKQIRRHDNDLWQHIDNSLTKGNVLTYRPSPPITWRLA